MSDTATQDEVQAHKVRMAEEAMRQRGEPLVQSVQEDYFGFEDIKRWYLPDGISFIEHKVLTEGDRRKYRNLVSREVKVQRSTGDALMRMAQGDDLHVLLTAAICGWNLKRRPSQGSDLEPVTFNERNLKAWLEATKPSLVDDLYKDITKANPWLLAEMTVEDIQKEIDNLTEMLAVKKKDEEAKNS